MEAAILKPVQSAFVSVLPSEEEEYHRRSPRSTITILSCLTQPVQFQNILNLEEKISAFLKLKENWDGFDAATPDEQVVSNAIQFINSLPDGVLKNIETETTPTPYGTIVIDFRVGQEFLSVEVGNTQIGFFSKFNNGDDLSSDGIDFEETKLPGTLLLALRKLHTTSLNQDLF